MAADDADGRRKLQRSNDLFKKSRSARCFICGHLRQSAAICVLLFNYSVASSLRVIASRRVEGYKE